MAQDQAIAQHWTAWPKHVIPAATVERQSARIEKLVRRSATTDRARLAMFRTIRNQVVQAMGRSQWRERADAGDPMAAGHEESWERLCMLTSVLDHLIVNVGGEV